MERSERTKLHAFMERHHITEPALMIASGVSIRHINNVKLGQADVSRGTMAKLLMGVRSIVGPDVEITDLFDFRVPRPARRQRSKAN